MKDPLQREPTPYEVLEVKPGTTGPALVAAVANVIAKGTRADRANKARSTLAQPTERALVDVFLYQTSAFATLRPPPIERNMMLEARPATAQGWLNGLQQNRHDVPAVHALALLYFWWAVHDDQRTIEALEAGQSPSVTDVELQQRWQACIALWTRLCADQSLRLVLELPAELIDATRSRVHEVLETRLSELASRYRALPANAGDQRRQAVERLERLQRELHRERECATALLALGLSLAGSIAVGGPLFWALLGARGKLDDALRGEQSPAYLAVKRLFSEHGELRVLLDQKKGNLALQEIGKLPAEQRAKKEVRLLEAEARHQVALQHASVGRYDDAWREWESLLPGCPPGDERARIEQELGRACLERVIGIEAARPAESIELLERLQRLVPNNPELKDALAERLARRGLEQASKINERLESGERPHQDVLVSLRSALADVERASELGSRLAKEHEEGLRAFVEHVAEHLAGNGRRQERRAPGATRVEAREEPVVVEGHVEPASRPRNPEALQGFMAHLAAESRRRESPRAMARPRARSQSGGTRWLGGLAAVGAAVLQLSVNHDKGPIAWVVGAVLILAGGYMVTGSRA